MYTVKSARLGFMPMTIKMIESALKGKDDLEIEMKVNVPNDFLEPVLLQRVFPIRLDKIKINPEMSKWYGFIIELESNTVIGIMGFKALPDKKGLVEIGYGINSKYQGKGYASEMAMALKNWVFQQPNVRGMTAKNVLKENTPSIKILNKLGMKIVKEHENTYEFVVYNKEDW